MKILGSFQHSPLQMSQILTKLKIPHTLYRGSNNGYLKLKMGIGRSKVLVADGLTSIKPVRGIVIVLSSRAELALTNIPLIQRSVEKSLKSVKNIDYEISDYKVKDVVATAVKPSLLTAIQTEIYRIPALHRKNAQELVLAYLDSRVSKVKLIPLRESPQTRRVWEAAMSNEALRLREAIARFRSGEDILSLERSTGFTSFDLLYVTRSSDKKAKNVTN